MRSRYFVRLEYFSTPCLCMILKKSQMFFARLYICRILLKVVDVCFGAVLCSEVGNVALHDLPTPGSASWIDIFVVASRPALRSQVPP